MDYLANDYLIPVVLGEGADADNAASFIYKKTSIRPYLLSRGFSLNQRLMFKCKKMVFASDFCIVTYLCDLADKLESRGSPLLVYTKEYENLVIAHSEEIESRYVCVSAHKLINNSKEP